MPTCIETLQLLLMELEKAEGHADQVYALRWAIKELQKDAPSPLRNIGGTPQETNDVCPTCLGTKRVDNPYTAGGHPWRPCPVCWDKDLEKVKFPPIHMQTCPSGCTPYYSSGRNETIWVNVAGSACATCMGKGLVPIP